LSTKFIDGNVQYFKLNGTYNPNKTKFKVISVKGNISEFTVNGGCHEIYYNPNRIYKYHVKINRRTNRKINLEYNEIDQFDIDLNDGYEKGFLVVSGFT